MLIEQTLFETVDKVAESIQLLRDHEPPEGYYLCFSGGKDSTVIKALAERAGAKFDAHYQFTHIEPPEAQDFIRQHHPDVIWDIPPPHDGRAHRQKRHPAYPSRQILLSQPQKLFWARTSQNYGHSRRRISRSIFAPARRQTQGRHHPRQSDPQMDD